MKIEKCYIEAAIEITTAAFKEHTSIQHEVLPVWSIYIPEDKKFALVKCSFYISNDFGNGTEDADDSFTLKETESASDLFYMITEILEKLSTIEI